MPKEFIDKREEPLKWACNHAFYFTRKLVPKVIGDKVLAFSDGVVAGYAVAWMGELAVHPYVIEPMVGASLEETVSHSLVATAGVGAGIFGVVGPKKIRDWAKGNKRYAAGVAGVIAGAYLKAIEELVF